METNLTKNLDIFFAVLQNNFVVLQNMGKMQYYILIFRAMPGKEKGGGGVGAGGFGGW